MFRIVNRLIRWTGNYKRRIYIGFIYALIHSIFTAIPIMLAAYGLSAVLDDFNGIKPLEIRDIWLMLGAMIMAGIRQIPVLLSSRCDTGKRRL